MEREGDLVLLLLSQYRLLYFGRHFDVVYGFVGLGEEVSVRELAWASRRNDAQTELQTPPSLTSPTSLVCDRGTTQQYSE